MNFFKNRVARASKPPRECAFASPASALATFSDIATTDIYWSKLGIKNK